jgi:hypothetical protein
MGDSNGLRESENVGKVFLDSFLRNLLCYDATENFTLRLCTLNLFLLPALLL